MLFDFYKYHGTGNDFILFDDRDRKLHELTKEQVAMLCHRRFGIGADGLILIRSVEGYDFEMVYYNSDGGESSMCGNGGRCISMLAHHLGIVGKEIRFLAIDGPHEARISGDKVELKMQDVNGIMTKERDLVLDTGSPHYLIFDENIKDINLIDSAHAVRFSDEFKEAGINVNLVEAINGNSEISVRTYERGVENETYSCGTGVVASSVGFAFTRKAEGHNKFSIHTPGGDLETEFDLEGDTAKNVWLIGPAKYVFEGQIDLSFLT